MSSSAPVLFATARIAAVVFALSACGLLVYREHVRAQAPGSVLEESVPGEIGGELDEGGADTTADFELPELRQLDGVRPGYLYSSKSMPLPELALPGFLETDGSFEFDEVELGESPPTYFPSSKSAPVPPLLPLFPPVEKP